MILGQLYNDFGLYLSHLEKNELIAIRNIIFEWAGISRQKILMDPQKEIDAATTAKIQQAVLQLRSHKPVQYITSEAWFYKLKFLVSPSVLIPRPETEELIELAVAEIKNKSDIQILDIGTGSGCIAITLKKIMPSAEVTAIDVSANALRIAKANAAFHNSTINFIKLNFLDKPVWDNLVKYDIIISNPPYIPLSEASKMENNVTTFEPHLALFVPDESPYIFYEKIAAFAQTHLAENGKIFMEVHEEHAKQVASIFVAANFIPEIRRDISGKERMVLAGK